MGVQEKAEKLHEQLHGSTFHIKLAKEAMKKVREAEAAVQAKLAEEAEALRQGIIAYKYTHPKRVFGKWYELCNCFEACDHCIIQSPFHDAVVHSRCGVCAVHKAV